MKLLRTLFLTNLAWISVILTANAQQEATTALFPFSNEFIIEYTFTAIAIVLLVIIFLLSRFYSKLLSERGQELLNRASKNSGAAIIIALLILPNQMQAAESGITAHMTNITFFVIALVILIELFVILFLVRNITSILGLDQKTEAEEEKSLATTSPMYASLGTLWAKLNAFKSKEKEKELLKDHEYDGIRELDNDLPPWWLYGFYLTIIFSVIYMWRYHVSETAPLQQEELEISIADAEEKMRAYRATAANLVDETTITVIEDYDFVEKGRLVYMSNCVACHGTMGEGGVGPNLTDEYWIHGGGIKDIFKIVKYGVVEKGMTPWKDLLSPTQMAQVANYVLTLEGTDPPNRKEPQGEKYEKVEEVEASEEEEGVDM